MSFKIFASGTGSFSYTQDKCIEGSDFTLAKILAIMQNMQVSALGVVAGAIEYKTPGIIDLVEGMANREFVHNLRSAVEALAMKTNASDGWISVSITIKNLIKSDTIRIATYKFKPGTNPGKEFIDRIYKSLEDQGMNNWGVVRSLSIAIGKFATEVKDSKIPALNISLTK
jgi:hypothetical protein